MEKTNTFGSFFKQQRVRIGLSLRQFCDLSGLDAGNTSRLERGLLTPPRDKEKLTRYARALGLEACPSKQDSSLPETARENSDAWYEFFDRAAIARGEIPDGIFNHEEMSARLGDIMNILQGRSIPEKQQNALVSLIRKNPAIRRDLTACTSLRPPAGGQALTGSKNKNGNGHKSQSV